MTSKGGGMVFRGQQSVKEIRFQGCSATQGRSNIPILCYKVFKWKESYFCGAESCPFVQFYEIK